MNNFSFLNREIRPIESPFLSYFFRKNSLKLFFQKIFSDESHETRALTKLADILSGLLGNTFRLLLGDEAAVLLKLKLGRQVSLHLKVLDPDFSSQCEHIIPGHDLWGGYRGGVSVLGGH